jgi:hypothetical protein
MNVKLFLVASCLLLLCLDVDAASHRKIVFVNQYDLDGDWLLYAHEFAHARKKRFKHTDENQDRVVNEEEYVFEYQNKLDTQLTKDRKAQVRQTIVRFNAMDKNDNGSMEWQEYEASGLRSFSYYDTNKDENINTQDPEPVNNRRRDDSPNMTKQQREKRRNRQLLSAKTVLEMPSTHNPLGMFSRYDNNQDGSISKAEHHQRRRADFDSTDENNNGWLSQDEYLFEYQNRMDKQIAKIRRAAIKQTYVRFDALDTNDDGQMTLIEYHFSGNRSFNRWDINQDNIVSMSEELPERKGPELKDPEPSQAPKPQSSIAQVAAVNDK